MAAAAIFDFLKYQIFSGRNGQEVRTASSCQIPSKSLEPAPVNTSRQYGCPKWHMYVQAMLAAHEHM